MQSYECQLSSRISGSRIHVQLRISGLTRFVAGRKRADVFLLLHIKKCRTVTFIKKKKWSSGAHKSNGEIIIFFVLFSCNCSPFLVLFHISLFIFLFQLESWKKIYKTRIQIFFSFRKL